MMVGRSFLLCTGSSMIPFRKERLARLAFLIWIWKVRGSFLLFSPTIICLADEEGAMESTFLKWDPRRREGATQ
jgi:hypothetical protein